MAVIIERVEAQRGCGYRKPGGLYLIGGKFGMPCGKLPIPLTNCPCCNAGIKFTRSFQWVSSQLVETVACSSGDECRNCVVWSGKLEHYGLMWVGEKYYPTPEHFMKEGNVQGISKRIAAIPNKFEVGADWILLAHLKTIKNTERDAKGAATFTAGIFQAFCPTSIEYVVTGEETQEELEAKEKRGITLVKVIKDSDVAQPQLI
jgi:hypothetical protein